MIMARTSNKCGNIGKDAVQTTNTQSITITTNDKDCPSCILQGSKHDDTTDPTKLSFDKAAAADPTFGTDVKNVSIAKSTFGISPLQGEAIGMDKFNDSLNLATQVGSTASEGVVGVLSDAINAITTFAQPVNPESLSREHRVFDGTTYLNQQ